MKIYTYKNVSHFLNEYIYIRIAYIFARKIVRKMRSVGI